MAELRTLKDLGCAVTSDNLRDEAVKWIKDLDLDIKSEKLKGHANYSIGQLQGIISWIKHFFNISEEDLK